MISLLVLLCMQYVQATCPVTSSDTSNMSCPELISFVKYHAIATVDEMKLLNVAEHESILAGILSATLHIVSALFVHKEHCLTESVKFALMMFIRESKLSLIPNRFLRLFISLEMYIGPILLLANTIQFDASPTQYYTHEHDGRYSLLETLRIATFNETRTDPICLLQTGVDELFHQGDRVADWGSGPLAVHSTWFNQTEFVTAIAFDTSPDFVSEGKVIDLDLAVADPRLLGFDWIWMIDLIDTVLHFDTILRNVRFAAPTKGVVLTTNSPGILTQMTILGFVLNEVKTESARNRCLDESIYIFHP